MPERRARTDVPYTADQMFDLVADVERYPEFLPWCVALRVVENNVEDRQGRLLADMVAAYKVFRAQFRSDVTLHPAEKSIDVVYVDGPFRHLHNVWRFEDASGGGSVVDFFIEFEFKDLLMRAAAEAVFEKAFAKMSEAFVARADVVYGDAG